MRQIVKRSSADLPWGDEEKLLRATVTLAPQRKLGVLVRFPPDRDDTGVRPVCPSRAKTCRDLTRMIRRHVLFVCASRQGPKPRIAALQLDWR